MRHTLIACGAVLACAVAAPSAQAAAVQLSPLKQANLAVGGALCNSLGGNFDLISDGVGGYLCSEPSSRAGRPAVRLWCFLAGGTFVATPLDNEFACLTDPP
jgi:hypothetical protein